MSMASWGNALYAGEKSYPIIQNRKKWVMAGALVIIISILLILVRGLNPSIEFQGGSQFSITKAQSTEQSIAYDVLAEHGITEGVKVSQLGTDGLRVQSPEIQASETPDIRASLAKAYGVEANEVDATVIGPSWGADVTKKALQSLIIFIVIVGLMMTFYFRSWPMSVAALWALIHDAFFTVGFFALTQVEVSPATVIGFLTILAYSLYDTVVVSDRARELTVNITKQSKYTFGQMVNLAVNQTLVRSINTSIVALLPVGSILFLGSMFLGAGTLTDISLALFVGLMIGTLSSVIIAPSALVMIEERRSKIGEHTKRVEKARAGTGATDGEETPNNETTAGARQNKDDMVVGVPVPGRHLGQQAQPRKKRKKRN